MGKRPRPSLLMVTQSEMAPEQLEPIPCQNRVTNNSWRRILRGNMISSDTPFSRYSTTASSSHRSGLRSRFSLLLILVTLYSRKFAQTANEPFEAQEATNGAQSDLHQQFVKLFVRRPDESRRFGLAYQARCQRGERFTAL